MTENTNNNANGIISGSEEGTVNLNNEEKAGQLNENSIGNTTFQFPEQNENQNTVSQTNVTQPAFNEGQENHNTTFQRPPEGGITNNQ